MSKRTRRYGGFRIGDKVKAKGYDKLNGEVVGFLNGYLKCVFNEITPRVEVVFAPNQLINLTRIEENKITDLLPPMSEETAKELDERFDAIDEKNKRTPMVIFTNPTREHWTKRFIDELLNEFPSPYTRDVYTSSKDYPLST